MKKKILTITLNPAIDYTIEVPHFRTNEVNRASSGRRDPGGKGINLATALSQGGLTTAVTGFLGKANADIFKNHFSANHLQDEFVYIQGPTREGIKVADPEDMITTDINFTGFNLKPAEIQEFRAVFADLVKDFDYVAMAGSLPAGVPDTIYAELAVVARDAGVFTAVDTSGIPLQRVIESGAADLIKPNIDELVEIYPEELNSEDPEIAITGLMDEILKKVGMVTLTLGGDGSRLYLKDRVYQATAADIIVKSTVGAGDTFLAGFIGGLALGEKPEEALLQAVCWTSSKLTMFGPGLSKKQPPESFAKEIRITRLS